MKLNGLCSFNYHLWKFCQIIANCIKMHLYNNTNRMGRKREVWTLCYVPDLLIMCRSPGPMLTCGAVHLLGYVFRVLGPLVMWLRVLARWLVVCGYQPIGYMCGLPVPQPCLPGSCMTSQQWLAGTCACGNAMPHQCSWPTDHTVWVKTQHSSVTSS